MPLICVQLNRQPVCSTYTSLYCHTASNTQQISRSMQINSFFEKINLKMKETRFGMRFAWMKCICADLLKICFCIIAYNVLYTNVIEKASANYTFFLSQDIYFWLILFLHIKLIGNVRFGEYCWFSPHTFAQTSFNFCENLRNLLLLFKCYDKYLI